MNGNVLSRPTPKAVPRDSGTSSPDIRRAALSDVRMVAAGLVPFGITLGVTVVETKTGALPGVLGGFLVFGGSAQLTAIGLLHLGAGMTAAIVSAAVVNLRVLMYGAALEPWFRGQPLWFRILGSHFIQDQTYLSAIERPEYRREIFRRYWLWLGSLMLLVWTSSVAVGVLAGPLLPPLPHLGLVGTALFVAMLVPRLVNATAIAAAATSAAGALLVSQLAPQLGIISGACVGVLAAMFVERRALR